MSRRKNNVVMTAEENAVNMPKELMDEMTATLENIDTIFEAEAIIAEPTLEELAAIEAANDILEAETFLEDEPTDSVFAIYELEPGKFTANNLFDAKNKQRTYNSVENAEKAQNSGKYGEKTFREVTAKPQGAPRKSGVQVSELTLPEDFDTKSKAWRARFLVEAGVTMGDTARYMNVRFQQVYQAVSYGKRNSDD